MRVYLGDLRYNYSGVLANDCMPLGVAYMKAVMDREDRSGEIDSRIFVYPEKLLDAIVREPPDVLMLTNYVWNEALSHYFFRRARASNPDVLTVMGGPNISLEPERQVAFLGRHPHLDVYALGEGDFLAHEIVRTFMDAGLSRKKLGEAGLPSSVYRNGDGVPSIDEVQPRHKVVEEIPSPWLSGIQDEFFDGRLAPMIETNRGCPFTCTFCVQGTKYYSKIHNFPVERIKDEIGYIARRIKDRSPQMGTLRIADSNYGMYERDVDISAHIGRMQKEYGWPTFIDATTGKNKPERIIKSVEQVSGALVLYQAVQSLDEEVLRKVKRQAIKLDAYKALEVHMRGRGLRSNSDLILGLPGESLESHLRGLHALLDSNINQMHNFQAMMLKGAEMETQESRTMFKFDTRFRVLPKNYGVYGDEKVFDVEEIIVATDTLPFADYLTCRKWHLVSSVFWNDGWFADVVRFVNTHGVRNSEWWARMLPALERGNPAVRGFLDSFVGETVGELFPDRESCIAFYSQPENFRKLGNGEIGDNLMYRYRAIASFQLWDEICAAAMEATRELLVERGVPERIGNFDLFWRDLSTYVRLRHASGGDRESILAPVSAELAYDFPAWLAAESPGDPNDFRLPRPTTHEFRLEPDARRELESALAVWSTHIKGLSKLVTRINVAWQVRECLPLNEGCVAEAV
ncbi:MAG TPA: cobalamin-dependent protein [Rhodocyclaceae bacterium]|nr:cobalamin-dependent protein [Rhodocyclaceae bacterium]